MKIVRRPGLIGPLLPDRPVRRYGPFLPSGWRGWTDAGIAAEIVASVEVNTERLAQYDYTSWVHRPEPKGVMKFVLAKPVLAVDRLVAETSGRWLSSAQGGDEPEFDPPIVPTIGMMLGLEHVFNVLDARAAAVGIPDRVSDLVFDGEVPTGDTAAAALAWLMASNPRREMILPMRQEFRLGTSGAVPGRGGAGGRSPVAGHRTERAAERQRQVNEAQEHVLNVLEERATELAREYSRTDDPHVTVAQKLAIINEVRQSGHLSRADLQTLNIQAEYWYRVARIEDWTRRDPS